MSKTSRKCMKWFLFHTLPRHSKECRMRNRQSMKYFSNSFRILCGKARDLTRASGSEFVSRTLWFVRECQNTQFYLNLFNKKSVFPVLHESEEASCIVGGRVMIYSRGRQPMAYGHSATKQHIC
ncbi:hypothetical protein TNCV_112441 [Trichonephila clavipes]|nr:hypothetical protein TNCV_112441 [Trichonephila clavipes]